jgi:hypothetical protein
MGPRKRQKEEKPGNREQASSLLVAGQDLIKKRQEMRSTMFD